MVETEQSMCDVWTEQDEATYQPLRRKLLRIQAKAKRDKTRKRKYSPRLCSSNDSSKSAKELEK